MSRLIHISSGPYAPPAPARELTVTSADGARLHAETHGPENGPAIVLAHGWTCSTVFWAPVIRKLAADGHRVIVYDQRGHGRSPAAPGGYSTHALADDLCAVLDATLDEGERAVIGGHSMGGMTIMAAADRPELGRRAAALLLCSTGASRLPGEARVLPFRSPRLRARAHRLLLGSRAPMGPVTPISKKAVKYATMGPGSAPDKVEACARIVHACPRTVRAAWGAVLGDLDLAARIPELTAPTAVIIGTQDRLTPIVHARELAAALPDCAGLHELAGLGHMTPIEAPEAVTDVLGGLVREHLAATDAGRDTERDMERGSERDVERGSEPDVAKEAGKP
ncbi:alpha/beta fold hydrolase [Streptomyces gobiensis]|uniref:alpha/beta fold hydrolase n=1 Tax=Streptomyces gobiensis TaxID=2875706 RepID=UPI001E435C87|nr:alpha/beta hydrolase [Streptomyces gobiensis]UGY91881.1 alpha/beta hydrolase [Streptomyces gobiensis]